MWGGRGRGRGPGPQQLGVATEDFRIRIDTVLSDFMKDHSSEEYPFPADMNSTMRRYVHERCMKLGLKSKSYGKEPNRVLVISKKKNTSDAETFDVGLSNKSADLLMSLNFNVKAKLESSKRSKIQGINFPNLFIGALASIVPPVPNPLLEFRQSLPIYEQKDAIMEAIRGNNVVIISAETGSGKTTQIPQYILEDACAKNDSVRVVCTQPRRLSTISVAGRVAAERGERLGQTIGYQIKHESNVGMNTAAIYCTNGILLRSFMSGDVYFNNITHIIVDEIHERDKFADFLLICLRESIKKFPHLRVILMSATMDVDMFTTYFTNPTIVNVKGRCFQIKSIFLDEVLLCINYENRTMNELRTLRERNGAIVRNDAKIATATVQEPTVVDPELVEELDELLKQCLTVGTEEQFVHLLQLILNENVSPNYQDTINGLTPLMVAAARGNVDLLEKLLNLGADPFMSCNEGLTASGWAQRSNNGDVVRILAMYQDGPSSACQRSTSNSEVSQILIDYDRTINEEFIDFELVASVVEYIHRELDRSHAILVFLPGYDDIMNCHERIKSSLMDPSKYKVFMLHGNLQTDNQKQVFARMPEGIQKIILSTNIAETSITIDDVMYVVDSGKVKMKCYDTFSGVSSLRPQWISMASAMQRAGRAGRTGPGYCFHLYSLNRYNSFSISNTPEILRVPLHELCLYTKALSSKDMSIQTFLDLAIEPPSSVAVKTSINVLKNLGAIDANENLTQLGDHLMQLSIEPHLGKMLIYAAIFRCLDPVLTIVACLAHKDPFVLPTNPYLRNSALKKRTHMSDDSLSDHFTMLRAFQLWEKSKVHNRMYHFCDEHFISCATMEMITLTRHQLLTQLRSRGFIISSAKDSMRNLNMHSHNWAMVKACLSTGLYPNVAYYNDKKLHTRTEKHVIVNQNSVLKQFEYLQNSQPTNKLWFMYEELAKMYSKCSIRCATAVTPLTIALVCGLNAREQDGAIVLDGWYELNFHNCKVAELRAMIDRVVQKKIDVPSFYYKGADLETINALAGVLLQEDMAYEINQPYGIGKVPKISSHRHYPYDRWQEAVMITGSASASSSSCPSPVQQPQGWRGMFDPTAGIVSRYNYHLAVFPPDALYFILKAQEGTRCPKKWRYSATLQNKLLSIPLRQNYVILIYARQNEQKFCGVSRFLGENMGYREQPFELKWLTLNDLAFDIVKDFMEPDAMEDGFQLQSKLGQRLCNAIYDNQRANDYEQSCEMYQFGEGGDSNPQSNEGIEIRGEGHQQSYEMNQFGGGSDLQSYERFRFRGGYTQRSCRRNQIGDGGNQQSYERNQYSGGGGSQQSYERNQYSGGGGSQQHYRTNQIGGGSGNQQSNDRNQLRRGGGGNLQSYRRNQSSGGRGYQQSYTRNSEGAVSGTYMRPILGKKSNH